MAIQLASHEEPLKGYRLIERLGRGGFGEVWKVEAPGGLLKAMKFVFGDLESSDEESRPAEQELKALKRVQTIRHPYILSLERYDIIDGQLMIVMELADRNLWDRYRECRKLGYPGIPRDELIRYMEETAEALDLMNNHYQIQHLDVKPQNLFLVFNHVKVGDFGLAKLLEREKATVTGGVTPVYAAPETFEGYVSRFSDQYSLAIVYQELLTGSRPFTGANTRQLLMQHISGTPDLFPLAVADKPIIARALAKKPEDRWPSCMDLVRAIKLATSGPATSPPITPTTPVTGRSPAPPTASGSEPDQITLLQHVGPNRPGSDSAKTQTPLPAYIGPKPSSFPSHAPVLPALVTVGPTGQIGPRLVTPSSSGIIPGPANTLTREQVLQTARMHSLGVAPPEKTGDGVLMPALVVGAGQLGRLVVEGLQTVVSDRFGSLDRVPNVRFLTIDTDPSSTPAQAEGSEAAGFILTKLNRPTHYLQRESLPQLDEWLPAGSLYKISRNPGAADGVRSFGRLALIDNFRMVAQRVRQELEVFLSDEILEKTSEETSLGLRTNRPRIYVIAGLGGGTGGGMFIDLAHLIRNELRGVGYSKPDVVGMFLVPPGNRAGTALGNTYAALQELLHFQARRTRYITRFDKSEAPVMDQDAPFARVALLQLPKSVNPIARQNVVGRVARSIYNEILTTTGRVVDEIRDVYRNAYPTAEPTCQSFGLFRLTWPRPEVLSAATRRFAQRLIHRWTSKDASNLREPVATWLEEQWTERQLDLEHLVQGFEDAAHTQLREEPEKVFDAFIDPLRTRTPSSSKLDAGSVCTVLEELLKLVGKADAAAPDSAGSLRAPLAAYHDKFCKESESHLATMAVTFIERPQYRFAGAEEAVRQIEARLKRLVDTLTPMYDDLVRELKPAYTRMLQLIAGLTTGSTGWRSSNELLELLRSYPRKRLRIDILDLALSAYRRLLGTTPDYLRDIGTCRAGLNDIHDAIGSTAPSGNSAGPGKLILPEGCKTLDDAADRFLAGLSPDDVLAFDEKVQKEINRKYRGLAAVGLKPQEKGPSFRERLLRRTREFLDVRLDAADPAAVFFHNRTGNEEDYPLIAEAFDGSEPDLLTSIDPPPDELAILAVPPGEVGDRFRAVVASALPGIEFTAAPQLDDIVFYRECPQLPLELVPQLGENGKAAYNALCQERCPHSRMDVSWKIPGEEPPSSLRDPVTV